MSGKEGCERSIRLHFASGVLCYSRSQDDASNLCYNQLEVFFLSLRNEEGVVLSMWAELQSVFIRAGLSSFILRL